MADVGLAQYLRRLPHNVEAEAAVLGTILYDDGLWARVGHRLDADDFVLAEHRALFAEIAARKAVGQRIDPVLLKAWAEAEPPLEPHGGARFLIELTNHVVVPSMIAGYVDEVAGCAERRRLIDVGEHLVNSAYSGNGTLPTAKVFAIEELTASRSAPRRNVIRVADSQGQPLPTREWLVPDWLPMKHVASLYGDGGTGKTLVAQQLMASCSAGVSWFGLQTVRCPSLGLFCEDDIDELILRQEDINRDLGIDFRDLADMHLWSLLGDDAMLMEIDGSGRGHLTQLWHDVRRRVQRLGIKLLVVDTAAATFGGNELVRSQVTQFTRACLGRLALEMNGVVVMCAHPSKSGLASGEGDGGSTAWSAGVRSRLYFARETDGDENHSDTDRRVLTRKKANYAAAGDEIKLIWRNGVFVTEAAPAVGIFGSIEKRNAETAFLEALDQATAAGRNLSDSGNASNYAPRVLFQMPAGRGFKLKDFERAMNRLFGNGKIRVVPYGPPSNGTRRIERVPQ